MRVRVYRVRLGRARRYGIHGTAFGIRYREDEMFVAAVCRAADDFHAQVSRDAFRRRIFGSYQRNHPRLSQRAERVVATCAPGFRGEPVAPERPVDQIGDLALLGPVHRLPHQAGLPDRIVGRLVHGQPQTVPVRGVALHLPRDPLCRQLAREPLRVVPHHLRIVEHRGHELEIAVDELA